MLTYLNEYYLKLAYLPFILHHQSRSSKRTIVTVVYLNCMHTASNSMYFGGQLQYILQVKNKRMRFGTHPMLSAAYHGPTPGNWKIWQTLRHHSSTWLSLEKIYHCSVACLPGLGSLSPSKARAVGADTSCLTPGLRLSRANGQTSPSVDNISIVGAGGKVFSSALRKERWDAERGRKKTLCQKNTACCAE